MGEAAITMTDTDRLRDCRTAYRQTQVRLAATEEALAKVVPHDRCYRVWDAEGRTWLHIPMCYSAAISGPDQCICDYPKSRREEELEREVLALREAQAFDRAARKQLWERVTYLQNQLKVAAPSPEEGR